MDGVRVIQDLLVSGRMDQKIPCRDAHYIQYRQDANYMPPLLMGVLTDLARNRPTIVARRHLISARAIDSAATPSGSCFRTSKVGAKLAKIQMSSHPLDRDRLEASDPLLGFGLSVQHLYICSCLEQVGKLSFVVRRLPMCEIGNLLTKTFACVKIILGRFLFAVHGRK